MQLIQESLQRIFPSATVSRLGRVVVETPGESPVFFASVDGVCGSILELRMPIVEAATMGPVLVKTVERLALGLDFGSLMPLPSADAATATVDFVLRLPLEVVDLERLPWLVVDVRSMCAGLSLQVRQEFGGRSARRTIAAFPPPDPLVVQDRSSSATSEISVDLLDGDHEPALAASIAEDAVSENSDEDTESAEPAMNARARSELAGRLDAARVVASGLRSSALDVLQPPRTPLDSAWQVSIAELVRRNFDVPSPAMSVLGLLDRYGALRIGPEGMGFDNDDVRWEDIEVVRTSKLRDLLAQAAVEREVQHLKALLPPLPGRKWAISRAADLLSALTQAAIDKVGSTGLEREVVCEVSYRKSLGRTGTMGGGVLVASVVALVPEINREMVRMAVSAGAAIESTDDD